MDELWTTQRGVDEPHNVPSTVHTEIRAAFVYLQWVRRKTGTYPHCYYSYYLYKYLKT